MTSPAALCRSSDNENDDLAPFLPQPNFPWNNPNISNNDSDILGLINHVSDDIIGESSESEKDKDDKESSDKADSLQDLHTGTITGNPIDKLPSLQLSDVFVLSSPVRGTLAERKAA